jgi:hypothetical protein
MSTSWKWTGRLSRYMLVICTRTRLPGRNRTICSICHPCKLCSASFICYFFLSCVKVGALVNRVLSLNQLMASNVFGTKETVLLCSSSVMPKRFFLSALRVSDHWERPLSPKPRQIVSSFGLKKEDLMRRFFARDELGPVSQADISTGATWLVVSCKAAFCSVHYRERER